MEFISLCRVEIILNELLSTVWFLLHFSPVELKDLIFFMHRKHFFSLPDRCSMSTCWLQYDYCTGVLWTVTIKHHSNILFYFEKTFILHWTVDSSMRRTRLQRARRHRRWSSRRWRWRSWAPAEADVNHQFRRCVVINQSIEHILMLTWGWRYDRQVLPSIELSC